MRELKISETIANNDQPSLRKYFNDLSSIGLVSQSEEVMLSRRIRDGDQAALNQLVSSNLRFVISVAKQYQTDGIPLNDLINEGNIGLITAAQRFDETKGFKFISYAVWWIRQAIIFAIAEQSHIVHIPYNQVTLSGRATKVAIKLEQELGRSPSVEEIADALGISCNKVAEAICFTGAGTSIDRQLTPSGFTLHDTLWEWDHMTDREILKASVRQSVLMALDSLNDRDKDVVALYFGLYSDEPLTLEDIALKYNLSVEHTRRLKDNALKLLKNSRHAAHLKFCME